MLVAVGEVFQVTVDASQRHQKLCHQEEFIHCGTSRYQLQESKFTFCSKTLLQWIDAYLSTLHISDTCSVNE